MFALLAVITLTLAFLLKALGVSTEPVDLFILGVLFMALQMLWPVALGRIRT